MRFRVIGLEFDGLVEVVDGGVEFAFVRKCGAAIVECCRKIGVDFEGMVEVADGEVEFA